MKNTFHLSPARLVASVVTALSVAALLSVGCTPRKASEAKISIFCDHIETMAHQEGLPFAEVCQRLWDLGYRGADVRVFQDPESIRVLDSLGFAHACAITDIDYSKGEQKDLEDKTLAFMKEHSYKNLLLVPGLVGKDATGEDRDAIRGRIAAFTKRASDLGYRVMVEDFDNPRSICFNTACLDSLFSCSDKLGLVFDTGNFLFAGDDALSSLSQFSSRVGHVHLKDRVSAEDMTCTPSGDGCIPTAQIISTLKGQGYDGWYTIEQYGSRQMLPDCSKAIANVKAFLQAK